MTRKLFQQVVVITGANSLIGRLTALEFAKHGSSVVLAALNEHDLRDLAREIELMGGSALAVPTNMSDEAELKHLVQRSLDKFGRIDTWINYTPIASYGRVDETPLSEIEKIFKLGLMAEIYGTKVALSHMKQQGGGGIINVGSLLAKHPAPYQAVSCAAEHGLLGFTESLQLELSQSNEPISVSLVLPTTMDSMTIDYTQVQQGIDTHDPMTVAQSIVSAASHPRREILPGESMQPFRKRAVGLLAVFGLLGIISTLMRRDKLSA